MEQQVVKRLFTVAEYNRMGGHGIFSEDERAELIAGEIVGMTPVGSVHAACVKRLNARLSRSLSDRFVISVQDPIQLGERSEPQPDLAVLRLRADFYAQAHPQAEDALLVIEVAESSIDYDREVKLPLYARAGVPEAWLVNLAEGRVEVHSKPTHQGYQDVRHVWRGDEVISQTLPELRLTMEDIIG